MTSLIRKISGLIISLVLMAGLAGASLAGPALVSQPAAPKTATDGMLWNSGWRDINPGQILTLIHGLGGDPDDYAVELWFKDLDGDLGVHRRNYGGLEANGNRFGAHWETLTANTIQVYRQPDDLITDQVRVVVWIRPETPDYDSGWTTINTGQTITFDHGLSTNPNDLVVSLLFGGESRGIHHFAYGGLTTDAPPGFQGAYWHNLTDTSVQVTRETNDTDMQSVRVLVSMAEPPDYDSLVDLGDWSSISTGDIALFNHNLTWNPDLLIVHGDCQDTSIGGLGIHSRYAGGSHDSFTGWQGGNVQNLTENSVEFARRSNDMVCPLVRVRIWERGFKVYLPNLITGGQEDIQLSYDDGTAESWQSNSHDSGFAVRFSSPVTSAHLLRASFYLDGATGANPIQINVYDADQNALITPVEVTPPAGQGWYEVDLSAQNVIVSGDFYVGMTYPQESYDPSLGVDTTTPLDGRSYEVPWENVTSDYMIRAVLQASPEP